MATKRYNSIRTGQFRSGFEQAIANILTKAKVKFDYEKETIEYSLPPKARKYLPDFRIFTGTKFIYIEAKGLFDRDDRLKHLLLKEQHPDKDIRIVFQSAKNKIYKKSKTTYADWCDKHKIKWADKIIPKEWLKEF
jgi:hypothetical protein